MYVTMDVTFSETEYFYTSVPSTSYHQGENIVGNLSWLDLEGDVIIEQRVGPGTIGAEYTVGTKCIDHLAGGAVANVGDLLLNMTEPI